MQNFKLNQSIIKNLLCCLPLMCTVGFCCGVRHMIKEEGELPQLVF